MPSGRSQIVSVSSGTPVGTTCSVLVPFSSERLLVKAGRRPSCDQTGYRSPCSPAMSGYGGDDPSASAGQTALR